MRRRLLPKLLQHIPAVLRVIDTDENLNCAFKILGENGTHRAGEARAQRAWDDDRDIGRPGRGQSEVFNHCLADDNIVPPSMEMMP
jgi:hypothetical protein